MSLAVLLTLVMLRRRQNYKGVKMFFEFVRVTINQSKPKKYGIGVLVWDLEGWEQSVQVPKKSKIF